jgi:Domain of unknown function (DUF222)
MFEVIEQLDDTVSDLLAVDVDTVTDSELHEIVVALHRQSHRLAAARARLLARWETRGVWAADGSRSAAHRLARDTSTAVRTARRELGRARHLAAMPNTAAAVAEGALSPDHVDLLGAANDGSRRAVFADHEAMLVEQCRTLRFDQACRAVTYWWHRADTEAAEDDARRLHDARSASAVTTIDGIVDVRAWLDPIGGAAFKTELARLEHESYLADQRDGVNRTVAQRRADALVEMAQRSATAPTNGRRPRPLITVLVGDQSFTRLCELADGTVITPGQVVPLLGVAEMESILFDGPTTVISVSKRRTFTGALRRAIQVRDRHCQHPSGCDVPAQDCDVDHITPHPRGGQTSQFDGRIECPTHNRHHDKHDHHATPNPSRPVTRLDELRARLRWRYLHSNQDDDDDREAG